MENSIEKDNLNSNFRPKRKFWLIVLRWIGTLPASIIGSTIAYWIGHLLFWIIGMQLGHGKIMSFIDETVSSFLAGVGFVYCAALIAPRFRKKTALAYAGIFIFISGAAMLGVVITNDYFTLITYLPMMIGTIIGTLWIWKEQLEFH